MSNSYYAVTEVRFVLEQELTQAYVCMKVLDDDCPIGVQGWHHKTFPASMSTLDIMNSWATGKEDPLLWAQQAPEVTR